ncbi:MAG: hypothetical protein AAF696_27990, partial [Bacteroidota bacterium]
MSGFIKNLLLRLLLSHEEHSILDYLNRSKPSALKEIFQEVPKEELLKTEQAKKVLVLKAIGRVQEEVEMLFMEEESEQQEKELKKLNKYLNSLEEQLRGINYKLGEGFISKEENLGEFEKKANILRAHILGGDIHRFLDETEKILRERKIKKLESYFVLLRSRLNGLLHENTLGLISEHNLERR